MNQEERPTIQRWHFNDSVPSNLFRGVLVLYLFFVTAELTTSQGLINNPLSAGLPVAFVGIFLICAVLSQIKYWHEAQAGDEPNLGNNSQ
jgi:hypothetical protein